MCEKRAQRQAWRERLSPPTPPLSLPLPESWIYHVMRLLSIVFLIRWLYLNERIQSNNHPIGKLPKVIASHDSFQSPALPLLPSLASLPSPFVYLLVCRRTDAWSCISVSDNLSRIHITHHTPHITHHTSQITPHATHHTPPIMSLSHVTCIQMTRSSGKSAYQGKTQIGTSET